MKRVLVLVALLVAALAGGLSYRAAVQHDREYRLLMGRGDEALASGRAFEALEAYSGAIALRPESMLAYLRRGETYQRLSNLDAAARDLSRAAGLDSAATRPLEELGDVRYIQLRYTQAASLYERYLRLDDRSAHVGYKLALAHYREGNLAAALTAVDASLRNDDRAPDTYYLQALCFRDQRRARQAQGALERAIALAPAFVAAREELADLDEALDRWSDELEQLQLLAVLDRRVERDVALGLAHARWSGDVRESAASRARQADLAVLTLGNALERAPDQPAIYAALGEVWLAIAETRDDRVALDMAIEALDRVGSDRAASSHSLMLYGRALVEAGRVEGAERALQQAASRYPVDPAALLLYAGVAERRNHVSAARDALVTYAALTDEEKGFGGRAARIAALSLRLNDRETASQWVRRGLERDKSNESLLNLQHRLQ